VHINPLSYLFKLYSLSFVGSEYSLECYVVSLVNMNETIVFHVDFLSARFALSLSLNLIDEV